MDSRREPPYGLLTVGQVAEALGLREATIRQWIWMRQIEFVKVGRCVRIKRETVQQLIEKGTIPPLPEKAKT